MGTRSETGVAALGNRMRVCLLCDTVGVDAGTERQVVETAKRLDKNKFEVHVCCLETSPQLKGLEGYCQTAVFLPQASTHGAESFKLHGSDDTSIVIIFRSCTPT